MQSLLFSVPDSCKPRPANDPSCNPLPHTAAWLADRDTQLCVESSPGMRAFCAYAGMQADGYPSDTHPLCPLTGRPEVLGPARSPSDAYVSVGTEFNCFNSSKDPKDRLCIPRAYQRSIDCVSPAGELPGLLHRLLAWAERDYGRVPRFQCFHRGGYGSVPWLHLHSFDGVQADSICPLAATRDGSSPNPQPLKIVCAEGGQPVDRRVAQMLTSMSVAMDAPPPPPPPPPPPLPPPPPSPPPLPPPPPPPAARAMRGIVLTDVHMDPLYSPLADPSCLCRAECANRSRPPRPYGQPGCDAPLALLDLTLEIARRELPSPDFVFMLGGTLCRKYGPPSFGRSGAEQASAAPAPEGARGGT